MKRALVLAGGGAKGSYQVGVWKALAELGWKPDIITGTSVGCLNGALFVLDGYEVARDMWLTIRTKDVVRLPGENRPGPLAAFLQEVIRGGGLNVEPLEAIVDTLLDEDAMRRAPIRYGGDPPRDAGGVYAGLGGLLPRLPPPGDRGPKLY